MRTCIHIFATNDSFCLRCILLRSTGAEYELLPWLFARGALCRLRFLIIEWHLNQLPPHKRISALAIRLSLHSLLQEGCETPPELIEHDEPWESNLMVAVPGLYKLASAHSYPTGKAPYHTRRYIASDRKYLARAEEVSCGRSRPRCSSSRHADGTGSVCQSERLSCSFLETQEAMKSDRKIMQDLHSCLNHTTYSTSATVR